MSYGPEMQKFLGCAGFYGIIGFFFFFFACNGSQPTHYVSSEEHLTPGPRVFSMGLPFWWLLDSTINISRQSSHLISHSSDIGSSNKYTPEKQNQFVFIKLNEIDDIIIAHFEDDTNNQLPFSLDASSFETFVGLGQSNAWKKFGE